MIVSINQYEKRGVGVLGFFDYFEHFLSPPACLLLLLCFCFCFFPCVCGDDVYVRCACGPFFFLSFLFLSFLQYYSSRLGLFFSDVYGRKEGHVNEND